MKIQKPIFIIGAGRSGSTIFHHIFAEYPSVIWLSGLCNRFPDRPVINRYFLMALSYPVVGSFLRGQAIPGECYQFWEYHCRGFSAPFRDLVEQDVTDRVKDRLPKILSQMATSRRDRHLIKITGWPRIRFLKAIFPDAKFIHIVRDGRAVANSLLNVRFWRGWQGPHNWRWGTLKPELQLEWETHNQSFVALAAFEWKILMEAMIDAQEVVARENMLLIKYEDFCEAPIDVFREVISFCKLEWSSQFETRIKRYDVKNQNWKWSSEQSQQQQYILQSVLESTLASFGYE